jgi:hypothetical protein
MRDKKHRARKNWRKIEACIAVVALSLKETRELSSAASMAITRGLYLGLP